MAERVQSPVAAVATSTASSPSDEEYAAALAAWIAEDNEIEPVELAVTAAKTLHEIRERRES
jgi:hypothetical protein